MSEKPDNQDEESFIILGTSPGTSLDMKVNKMENGLDGVIQNGCLDKAQIEEALQDLSLEGSMALKASFRIGDSPSPGSMMVASTIITDDKSTEELQKRFGEILDENVILKETLKQNNDSMKEHFLLIATCQEDMVKTHTMHKEKFEETKELVEKLRNENRKLKSEIAALVETATVNDETGEKKQDSIKANAAANVSANDVTNAKENGPPSVIEFVTSPDDETLEKLSAQLALVEKQRREVITENEKLTWQKESLENIVDATAKERDELKEKLKEAEMNLYPAIQQRHAYIKQQNDKYTALQNDLKTAQMRILELENVKLEFAKYKTNMVEIVRHNKETINELNNKFKETAAKMLEPAKFVITWEPEGKSEYGTMAKQVKLYDKALGHLTDMLKRLTCGVSDALIENINVMLSLKSLSVDHTNIDEFKANFDVVAKNMELLQGEAMTDMGQVRATLEIFQDIFSEYKEAIRRTVAAEKSPKQPANVEYLTSALLARGEEIQTLREEINRLKGELEDISLMKAQLDLYKSDFEAERESREKMASEKENALTDLRKTKKLYDDLKKQVEESKIPTQAGRPISRPSTASAPPTQSANQRTMYTCPKCMHFSSEQYKVMEDHFDFCLDDF